MRLLASVLVVFFLAALPVSVLAVPPTDPGELLLQSVKHCDGDNLHVNITEAGTVTDYDLGLCPNGCNPVAGTLGAQCNTAPWLLPLYVYLILLGATTTCLVWGYHTKRYLLCMAATVFYLYLAFQAFIIEHDGHSHVLLPLVIICWFLAVVAFLFTLQGIKAQLEETREQKKKEAEARLK